MINEGEDADTIRSWVDGRFIAPILMDVDGRVARAYGVLAEGGQYALRVSFAIDRSGVIRRIDREVEPASYGPDLLQTLEGLGFDRNAKK